MCAESNSTLEVERTLEERIAGGFLDALDPVLIELEGRFEEVLLTFFESVAKARNLGDVTCAAGVARSDLLGIRESV